MRAHSDYGRRERRLADLKEQTVILERTLDSVRMSLESELSEGAEGRAAGSVAEERSRVRRSAGRRHHGDEAAARKQHGDEPAARHGHGDEPAARHQHGDEPAARYHHGDQPAFMMPPESAHQESPDTDADPLTAQWRTEALVSHGRHSTHQPHFRVGRKALIIAAAAAVVVTVILVIALSGPGASWPSSVATVQSEAARACQNPDVKSEPDQVDFACAPDTRQVLWVFALMTSYDDPQFSDSQTGRVGLEPITPDQGGQVAWSLNLHSPYNPLNPVDSLEVAARAINSIIGGATVTSASGSPVVQPGLEATAANCLRYTGSAAVTSRQGFPGLCARPVTTLAGQAALVADIYQKWMVGATPQAAQDAAVLFENAGNPGNPQVQAILRQLRNRAP